MKDSLAVIGGLTTVLAACFLLRVAYRAFARYVAEISDLRTINGLRLTLRERDERIEELERQLALCVPSEAYRTNRVQGETAR